MPTLIEVMNDNRALASLIEAKDREISRLEQKLQSQTSSHGMYVTQTLEPKIDELEARSKSDHEACVIACNENARLRAALRKITEPTYGTELTDTDEEKNAVLARYWYENVCTARDALQDTRQASNGAGNANPQSEASRGGDSAYLNEPRGPGISTTVQESTHDRALKVGLSFCERHQIYHRGPACQACATAEAFLVSNPGYVDRLTNGKDSLNSKPGGAK